MIQNIAIIGGSREAADLALYLDGQGHSYRLFETSTYRTNAIKSENYSNDTIWSDVLKGFTQIIVAPHPFAFDRVATIRNIDLPQIALRRPPWQARQSWPTVETSAQAAQQLMEIGAKRPLVAIGRERLTPFFDIDIPDILVRCRQKPLPELRGACRTAFLPGPFTISQEMKYLTDEGIDCIVAHNTGGGGGLPKIEAARRLNLPVILINMPDCPWPNSVTGVNMAIYWLRDQGMDLDALPT